MTDNTAGSAHRPTRGRVARRAGPLACIGGAVAALLVALPATASSVVKVRVGAHEAFTRVVFELDAAASYRISRNEPAPGIAELVVSLDAGGPAREVYDGRGLVENVTLVGLGPNGSIARIRLTRDGLHLKEMVLRSPPRVVLDILKEPEARSEPIAKAGASAANSPPAGSRSPAPVAVATRPEASLKPAAAGSAASEAPSRPAEQAVGVSAPSSSSASAGTETAAPATAEVVPRSDAGVAAGELAESPPLAGVPVELEARGGAAGAARTAPLVPPRSASRTAPAPRVKESSMDLVSVAIGATALLLAVAALLWWRRRAADAGEDFEVETFDPESDGEFEPSDEGDGVSADDSTEIASAEGEGDTAGVFDLSAHERLEEGDDGVEAVAEVEPVVVGRVGEEGSARLVRELERRIANLETRLDEVVDSRERVERQLAAQTEELRVQRAAIARTQRAVRQLSRAADDVPTEPALRDPGGG